jgi:hypothetical protein
VSGSIIMAADLHSVHKNCGIDSDAGVSISTIREDFAWLDESREARKGVHQQSFWNQWWNFDNWRPRTHGIPSQVR